MFVLFLFWFVQGTYCLDGTHVCDQTFWHDLDLSSECKLTNCSTQFGYYSFTVWSDGIDRYTPACSDGKQGAEMVFVATIPPGGLVELRVDTFDDEVPIFVESYVIEDPYAECPVANGGQSAGTGPYFQRCSSAADRYTLLQAVNDSVAQRAFIVVDVEDVEPMELTVTWRNTTAADIANDGASMWARAQICEIGHNKGLVGDGKCHSAYNSASCDWDGGDCRCVFGAPTTESFGDGTCDARVLGLQTNTRSCGWDGGDCAIDGSLESGGAISNIDKPGFNESEILDNYTVLPSSSTPETLTINRWVV